MTPQSLVPLSKVALGEVLEYFECRDMLVLNGLAWLLRLLTLITFTVGYCCYCYSSALRSCMLESKIIVGIDWSRG